MRGEKIVGELKGKSDEMEELRKDLVEMRRREGAAQGKYFVLRMREVLLISFYLFAIDSESLENYDAICSNMGSDTFDTSEKWLAEKKRV